jgi:hypothetical protein
VPTLKNTASDNALKKKQKANKDKHDGGDDEATKDKSKDKDKEKSGDYSSASIEMSAVPTSPSARKQPPVLFSVQKDEMDEKRI